MWLEPSSSGLGTGLSEHGVADPGPLGSEREPVLPPSVSPAAPGSLSLRSRQGLPAPGGGGRAESGRQRDVSVWLPEVISMWEAA